MLRLLKFDKGFTISIVGLAEEDQENVSEDYRKEIKYRILEADYEKAQAIMTMLNRRFY